MTLLLPISQCCAIRYTTLRTLLRFYNTDSGLGGALKKSLRSDDIAPVLLDKHFEAVNRRVKIILKTVGECLAKASADRVIIDDGF